MAGQGFVCETRLGNPPTLNADTLRLGFQTFPRAERALKHGLHFVLGGTDGRHRCLSPDRALTVFSRPGSPTAALEAQAERGGSREPLTRGSGR